MSDRYEIGFRKPPKKSRFKPGQSGNPKGRPKGRKNFSTELLEELQELIAVKENGKRRTVSKQRVMLKSLTAKAMQGDARAANIIANMVFRFLQQDDDMENTPDLSREDITILENFENRIRTTPRVRHRTRPTKGQSRE